MSTGRVRKRAGNGGSGSPTSGMQQGHQQGRQGSSFWTCPACSTAVHTALMSFHLSSCPVVADFSGAPAPKKRKPLVRHRTQDRPEHGTGQCPEFVSSSTRKRGIGHQEYPWEEDEDEGGDVLEEEQLLGGPSSSPLFMEVRDMGKLCPIPRTPNPETPIQGGREPMLVCVVESPTGDHTPEARKRLFEDWGQKLSPEPESELDVRLSPINSAAAPGFSVDPQTQRSKVMKPSSEADSGVHLSPINSADVAPPSSVDPRTHRRKVMEHSSYEGELIMVGLEECPERHLTTEARKRLFEDWGQKLSPEPEPESELVVHLSLMNASAAAATPSSVDPRTQRSQILKPSLFEDESRLVVGSGLTDSGSSEGDVPHVEAPPDIGSVQDSQQEGQQDLVAQQADKQSEGIPLELGKENASQQQHLRCDNSCSLGTGIEIKDGQSGHDGVSKRELELEHALQELMKKHSGTLLREAELQRALQIKNEECEEFRRREQEMQRELLFFKKKALQEQMVNRGQQKTASENHEFGQIPTQTYKEDESLATQLLSQTSNTLVSCSSSSPLTVKDEFAISRLTRVSSEDLLTAHNLFEADMGEQATQLVADDLSTECSPSMPDTDQNRLAYTQSPRVCWSGRDPLSGADGEHFPSRSPVRRLFEGGRDFRSEERAKHECVRPVRCPSSAEAVSVPQPPGKVDEDEKSKGSEERDNGNLHTVRIPRVEGTPGGPNTPENFAVVVGKQEKGLISEMLDSFPPAQGIATQLGKVSRLIKEPQRNDHWNFRRTYSPQMTVQHSGPSRLLQEYIEAATVVMFASAGLLSTLLQLSHIFAE